MNREIFVWLSGFNLGALATILYYRKTVLAQPPIPVPAPVPVVESVSKLYPDLDNQSVSGADVLDIEIIPIKTTLCCGAHCCSGKVYTKIVVLRVGDCPRTGNYCQCPKPPKIKPGWFSKPVEPVQPVKSKYVSLCVCLVCFNYYDTLDNLCSKIDDEKIIFPKNSNGDLLFPHVMIGK